MEPVATVTDPGHPLVGELADRQFRWHDRFRDTDERAAREAARERVLQELSESRLLELPGGFLWLGSDGDRTLVRDVLCSVDDVPAVRELATRLAGSALAVGLVPDDPVRAAFVDDGSFRLAATTMRLDLAGALPGEELADRVELAPMTDEESAAYLGSAVGKYALEREQAGESPALALTAARESFASLLPDGVRSPGQHLLTVRHDGRACGVLWVGSRWPDQAWIYDIEIVPGFRGQAPRCGCAGRRRAARSPDRARLARAQRVRSQPARPSPLRAVRLRGRGGAPPAGRADRPDRPQPGPDPVEGRGRPVDAGTASVEGPVGLRECFANPLRGPSART